MNVAPTSEGKSSRFRPGVGGTLPSHRRPTLKKAKINSRRLYIKAMRDAWLKLYPWYAIKNPVMFLVWLGTLVTLVFTIAPNLLGAAPENHPHIVYGLLTAILFLTVWLANFAEALALGRSQAQADVLQTTKSQAIAKKLASDGTITEVPASSLRAGDTIYLVAGDMIPADGKVIMGVASVDESLISGEAVPILKESGNHVASSVIGGTHIISDELIVRITSDPDQGFIDQMIALLAGTTRRKTPGEITLMIFLAVLSLVSLLVVMTLPAFADYVGIPVSVPILIALLVAVMPTTIGGLFNTISISAMNGVAQCNIIATSGEALEACADITTVILDKTRTITFGNRLAQEFIPLNGHSLEEMANVALAASVFDDTSEGKSITRVAQSLGGRLDFDLNQALGVKFSEDTRMSGTNFDRGHKARKGAVGAIKEFIRLGNGQAPAELNSVCQKISQQGGTPLAVCLDEEIYGVIYLKDIIKPGMREACQQLGYMGIKTIMLSGDNLITTSVIANLAGVNDFIGEATPEDKVSIIHTEQAAGKVVGMIGDGSNDAAALLKANVGVVMNTGSQAAKEAADIIDLDSDPTKLIDLVSMSRNLVVTRGALTIFSLANDITKYFVIIPLIFTAAHLQGLNIMNLSSLNSAVLSILICNAVTIPALIPLTLRGVEVKYLPTSQLLLRHLLIYGLGGIGSSLFAIKLIDMLIATTGWG